MCVKEKVTCKAISYPEVFRQSKTALFDWTFFLLDYFGPYYQSSRFYSCCALPSGGCCEGVLLYGSRKSLAALCFAPFSRAVRASRATNFRPSGLVPLGLAKSRQSYVRGVALSQ